MMNGNSPLQRALYGGQPGRRNRYQQYYQDQQQPGEQPVEVPETLPEEPSPVAQAALPQVAQQRPAPMKNSWQRQGGPIDQLFGNGQQEQPDMVAQAAQKFGGIKQAAPQPFQGDAPQSRPYGGSSPLDQLRAQPNFAPSGAPNPSPVAQAVYPQNGPVGGDRQASYTTPGATREVGPGYTAPPPTPQPAPQGSDFERGLTALYQTLLGRAPGPEDFAAHASHANNPNGLAIIGDAIRQSPEFQQRQQAGAPMPWSPTTTPDPNAPPAANMVQGRGFGSHGGDWVNFQYNPNAIGVGQYAGQLEGFDQAKLDPNHADANSMKYIFARAASNVDVMSPNAAQQVVDNLAKMGVRAAVENPDGEADRIVFLDTGESIDVMRGGAKVGPAGWQWIDALYNGQPAPGEQPPPTGPGGPAPTPTPDPLAQALLGQGIEPGTALWDMLMAQLQKKTGVGPAPDEFAPQFGINPY